MTKKVVDDDGNTGVVPDSKVFVVPPPPKEKTKTTTKLLIAFAALVIVSLLIWHRITRIQEASDPNPSAPTTAAVAIVTRRDLGETLTVAGAFKPFQNIDVHAKVAGYIKRIYVDVGDHVKQGQILAVLEIPELAAELAGTTLTAVAQNHGVQASDVPAAMKADVDAKIQTLADDGTIKAARAVTLKVKAEAKIDALMTRQFKAARAAG